MAPKSFFSFDLTPKEEDPYTPKFTAAFPEPSYTQAEQSLDATPFFGGSGLDSAMAAKSLPEASAALGGAYQGLSGQRTKLMSELSQEQDGTDWGSVAKQAVAALFPILGGYALSGNVGGAYGAQVGGALQQQIVKSDKEDQLKRDFQIKSQIADIDKRQAAIAGQKLGIDKSVYATENRAPILSPFQKGEEAAAIEIQKRKSLAAQAGTEIPAGSIQESALNKIRRMVGATSEGEEGAMSAPAGVDIEAPFTPAEIESLRLLSKDLPEYGAAQDILANADKKKDSSTSETILASAQKLEDDAKLFPLPQVQQIMQSKAQQLRDAAARGEQISREQLYKEDGETRRQATELNNQLSGDLEKDFPKYEEEQLNAAKELLYTKDEVIRRIHELYGDSGPAGVIAAQTIAGAVPGTKENQLYQWIKKYESTFLFSKGGKQLTQGERDAMGNILSGTGNLAVGALESAIEKLAGISTAQAFANYSKWDGDPRGALIQKRMNRGWGDVLAHGKVHASMLDTGRPDMGELDSAVTTLVQKALEAGGLDKLDPALRAAYGKHLQSGGFGPSEMDYVYKEAQKALAGQ